MAAEFVRDIEVHGKTNIMDSNLSESSNESMKKHYWKKFVLCGLSLFLAITIFAVLTINKSTVREKIHIPNVTSTHCKNDGNIKMTVQVRMDNKSVLNPCDDFYKFACQNWQLSNPRELSALDKIQNEELKLVSEILVEPIRNDDMPFVNEAKIFFKHCLITKDTNTCRYITRLMFWWAITHEIALRKYKNKENFDIIRKPILQMFHNIKFSLEELNLPLYPNTTPCIGMPEWIFDRDGVQSTYKGYSNGAQWVRQRYLELKIEETYGVFISNRMADFECQWIEDVDSAYYRRNKMVSQAFFLYIILQSPYFGEENLYAQNYGALGAIMGHELAHAYTSYYWDLPKDERMTTFINCLKRQYSSFELSDESITLDGENTAKENFADNLGLRGAYHAYQKLNKNKNDATSSLEKPILASKKATEDQQFFISFAQIWCETESIERMTVSNRKKIHSPARYRVLGTLQNFPEFSKAFNCPLGSNMNPCQENKCLVF